MAIDDNPKEEKKEDLEKKLGKPEDNLPSAHYLDYFKVNIYNQACRMAKVSITCYDVKTFFSSDPIRKVFREYDVPIANIKITPKKAEISGSTKEFGRYKITLTRKKEGGFLASKGSRLRFFHIFPKDKPEEVTKLLKAVDACINDYETRKKE